MSWDAMVRDALRRARLDSGLTRPALAEKMGASVRTVRRLENGEVDPRGRWIDPWFEACGWDAEVAAWPRGR